MSRIKECFISRYKGGVIMEADYSQLEVIVLAFLSNDHELRKDILDGIDIHSRNAAQLFGVPHKMFLDAVAEENKGAIKQRKIAKGLSFQLQYGAGAASMSEKLGIDLDIAKKFIENYYARYTGVKAYQEDVARRVKASRCPSTRRTVSGLPAGLGTYQSVTGRRYTFFEYDSPAWVHPAGTGFSPTQMKNYTTQGFATGDIVPLVFGHLYEELQRYTGLVKHHKLINTVHDNVVLDVDIGYASMIGTLVKKFMEDAPRLIKETWGIDFDLPLKVDVTWGPSWGKQTNSL